MDPASVQQLVQQVQSQQVAITNLQQELSSLKTTIVDGLLAKKDGSTKAKLPDVDKFDGSLAMWEVWLPEIRAKLRLDEQALGGTDDAKFWYIYGRLDKKIQALVAPQLKVAERTRSYDPENLFLQLARLCDNPNAKREAQDKLYSLRQFADQSFNAYLAVFERQLYKAEADSWDDEAKISLIRRQLNDKLKKRIRGQIHVPTDYYAFVKVLQQLDDSNVFQSSSQYNKPPQSSGDPMQIGNIRTAETDEEDTSDEEDDNYNTRKLLYNPKTGKYRKV